jgi:hypothetical protein
MSRRKVNSNFTVALEFKRRRPTMRRNYSECGGFELPEDRVGQLLRREPDDEEDEDEEEDERKKEEEDDDDEETEDGYSE